MGILIASPPPPIAVGDMILMFVDFFADIVAATYIDIHSADYAAI